MNQLILNGTEVKVEEIKGKTVITIETQDAEVVVNNTCIWSKNDKPEYQQIPVVLRDFLHDRCDFVGTEGDLTVVDLWEKDIAVCTTLYIPQNKRKKITARLDLISSLEEFEHEFLRNRSDISEETANELVKEFKGLFETIEQQVKEAGYHLCFSHGSGDFLHGWWDVSFTIQKWDEKKFLAIWNAFSDFDKRLQEVFNEYGI